MFNYLHAKLAEVEDADFQQMIDELHHCVGWRREDQPLSSAFTVLSGIFVQDAKALTARHLPTPGILTSKVDRLAQGAIYDFCVELVRLKHTHIESFDGKTVLSLIKTCFPAQKLARPRQPTRLEERQQRQLGVIRQRRRNGDL